MTDILEFKVAKRRKDVLPFSLEGDDHVYQFVPPKQAKIFMGLLEGEGGSDQANMARSVFDWLGAGLGEDEVNVIIARLKDDDDDLDIDTLTDVITGLTEAIAARPTT